MLHTLDYSRFSSECLCKKLQSLLLATCVVAWNVPGRRRMDRRSFGGGHCLPNLHRFVVSKVGLPSIWSLLAALIETMACAYPPFRISLSRFNFSRLSQYRNEIFVIPLQFKLDIRAPWKCVHPSLALWRVVSRIEDGYVGSNYPGLRGSCFYLPKYDLKFGFPATVLALLEYFISYLELRIHCLMYYTPPTPLSYLRSLTTP